MLPRSVVVLTLCLALVGLTFLAAGPLPAAATLPLPTRTALPVRATLQPTTPPTSIPPTATAQAIVAPTPIPSTSPPALAPFVEPLDPPEIRAVWVDAFHDGFKTPEQVDDLLAWARSANLNALFVQVRRRGDAYYLKSFEPRAEDPDLTPGFDALQYLIERAHQGPRPLQVHAWLATLPAWHQRDTPPQAPDHVFNLHGLSVSADDTWLMYRDDGEAWAGVGSGGIYYLDPGNPDAARYTADVYLNLVRNYAVDGIHLDQVRYYEGDPLRWGYNPTSVALFNQRFRRDPTTQPDPKDAEWIAWRRDQVTALVRTIYWQAKALRPNVAVTAAVVAWGQGPQSPDDWERQAPYAAVLQDWRWWLQEGIVDYLLPMDYYRETAQQSAWFDRWTQWQTSHTGRRGVVLGLGSYLNSADGSLAQLDRARALGALGVALYSYAVPTRDLENASRADRQAFADQLRAVFVRRAPVPDLPPVLTAASR